MSSIIIHDEVRAALRDGRPVVALESAFVTHGLPRHALPDAAPAGDDAWRADAATNLETARAVARAVRAGGAIPAGVCVLDGRIHVGVDEDALTRLAEDESAVKASVASLAHAISTSANAGTTVSATLAAMRLAGAGGIRVLATGGIGGVHRGWTTTPDVSADLSLLAATPVCVTCAGAKSILDVPATIAVLETLGVPIVGYRTASMPRFITRSDAGIEVPMRLDDAGSVAALCRHHWETLRRPTSVLLAQPPPHHLALDADEVERCLGTAEREIDETIRSGPDRTPRLLDELARLTEGRSVRANIAVLVGNASLAAAVACGLATGVDP